MDYIHKMIAQGEHQQLDFKFEISDSRKIARTLVAFANTDGGRLLIGVKDNGSVAGVRSEEEYYMVEAAAQMYCKPEVTFSSREWNVDGKLVLEIVVAKSNATKHKAPLKDDDYKVFIRVGDKNILADSILVRYWKRQAEKTPVKISFTEPEMVLLRQLSDKQQITLHQFMDLAGIGKKLAEKIIIDFLVIQLIRIQQNEKETLFKLQNFTLLEKMQKQQKAIV
jgi:hypothetical protein